MQGINLHRYAFDAYRTQSFLFLFKGEMPTTLEAIPFNPYNVSEFFSEAVGFLDMKPVGRSRFSRADDDLDLGGFNRIPLAYNNLSDAGGTSFSNWNSVKKHFSYNLVNATNFSRLGREGSSLIIDTIDPSIPIHGFSFRQRTVPSGQKERSWSGVGSYNTRCATVRLEAWDPSLNEGEGGWFTVVSNFNVNRNSVFQELDAPIVGFSRIRLVCTSGPIVRPVLVWGDPHWSVSDVALVTSSSIEQSILEEPTWGIVYPEFTEDFDYTQQEISNAQPFFVTTVGDKGSGKGIELNFDINNQVTSYEIHKFNLIFST